MLVLVVPWKVEARLRRIRACADLEWSDGNPEEESYHGGLADYMGVANITLVFLAFCG